jgi:hypothetical protein
MTDGCHDEVVLGGEVVELSATADPRALGDQGGRGAGIAALGQQVGRGLEEAGAHDTAALLLGHTGRDLGHIAQPAAKVRNSQA